MGTATVQDILADACAGRPFVIVDEGAADDTGHLVVPARAASPASINYMALHARGLICLAIDGSIATRLGLEQMPRSDASRRQAFAVSIEARDGVTTGISAADRARTIAVAADPISTAGDLVSPGHVFPILTRDGGTLVSPGHAEAAVDVASMAGLGPAAVVCEILDDGGESSRFAELRAFADRHDVRIVSVADIIAHRRRSEKLVERVATAPFSSRYCGEVTIHVYRDTIDHGEHVALVRGAVEPGTVTLVRVHQVDIATDLLGWSAARENYVNHALVAMGEHSGPSVAVFVHDPYPRSIADRVNGKRSDYMRTHALRDYGVGAQILRDLGVRDMVLLTSSDRKLTALEGFGLRVVRRQDL